MKKLLLAITTLAATLAASHSFAANGVVITEWMYQGAGDTAREFIEFTNLGPTAVDFTGWSYDDDSRLAGVFPLSAFGLVQPGESVVITEMNPTAFRSAWGLDASVKVWGPYTNNLGNGDEINLFDAASNLVDRLTYGGNPRTRGVSGRPSSAAALGANNVALWQFSAVGDVEGSWQSSLGDVGSPSHTSFAAQVPEPASYALMLGGLLAVGAMGRRARR